jgi:hypothetical protein
VGWVVVVIAAQGVATTIVAAPLLAVDVDDRTEADAGNTAPGFQAFTLTGAGGVPSTVRTIGGYTVSATAVNSSHAGQGGLDDRDRTTPSGTAGLNQLYDDFIFAPLDVGLGGGIDLRVSGGALAPNTQYEIAIYAFDSGSAPAPQPRTADWLDGNNGNAMFLQTAFSAAALPTSDDQYRFAGLAMTDSFGALLLRGRSTTGLPSSPGVFVNGFEIGIPAPPVGLMLEVNTTTGGVRLVNDESVDFALDYYELRSSAGSLNPAGWFSLDDGESGDSQGVGWDEADTTTASVLSEVNFSTARTLAPGDSINFGAAFTPGAAQDVAFRYGAPGAALKTAMVQYVQDVPLAGDFDRNNVVDGADLAQWRSDFGATNNSDGNGDNVSDGADFLIWQRNVGAAALAAVPEPGGILMLLIAAVVHAAGRRGRSPTGVTLEGVYLRRAGLRPSLLL